MLEVTAHDGAGRTAILSVGERRIETPALLWLPDRLPPGAQDWDPQLGFLGNARAAIVASTHFTDPAPTTAPGQLLLQRTLVPSASAQGDTPRLQSLGASLAVWGDAYDLAKDPKRLAPALARAREDAGFARALYAPGLGEPATLALLSYAGIDLFDAVPLHYAAARGLFLSESGAYVADRLEEPLCACPACRFEAPAGFTEAELAAHNQWAARVELGAVRNAIRAGRLRELAEARARAHPELVALLRRLDAEHTHFETRAPVARRTPLQASSNESLARVECRRFRDRVRDRYRPPRSPPVLLLLPCSARKPYSKSRTHRAFADAIWRAGAAGLVHEVILTSPLGLVPRELELTYPAAHYDVPVTGEWDEEEGAMIRGLLANLLSKRSYALVVSHLPKHTLELVRPLLPDDLLVTCEGENATAVEALQRLELALAQLTRDHARARLDTIHHERLRAIADYQFGPDVADRLFAETTATGKWPTGKVLDAEGRQLAMLPTDRGFLSLTLLGAERLLAAGRYRVEIDDFRPKGGVFAVGVKDADPEVRPGDEVVVHAGGAVRGVGTALMSGREMTELERGEAVNLRHHA